VVEVLSRVLGRPLEVDHGAARPGDVRHSQADNTRLRDLFPGIEPVDLRAGLERTVEWFRTSV
jgi:UDP-glucose 4-epimerase